MAGPDPRYSSNGEERFGYWPLRGLFLAMLLLLTAAIVLFISVAGYAYARVGIPRGWLVVIVISSFLGSRINIPVWRFRGHAHLESVDVVVFGVRYRIPAVQRTARLVIAVNVGGAVIPTAVSVYLIVHNHLWQHSLIAIACVAVVAWLVARPIPGIGIVTPALVPPVAAAFAAILLGKPSTAALAYICGTLGTLIGADLINLPRIRNLGAPVASIGGAGTFDGIFLAGLFAVVIATL